MLSTTNISIFYKIYVFTLHKTLRKIPFDIRENKNLQTPITTFTLYVCFKWFNGVTYAIRLHITVKRQEKMQPSMHKELPFVFSLVW